jgi:hypothetical protein
MTATRGGGEERSVKKYHKKCQIEKDVVLAAANRALKAKAKMAAKCLIYGTPITRPN